MNHENQIRTAHRGRRLAARQWDWILEWGQKQGWEGWGRGRRPFRHGPDPKTVRPPVVHSTGILPTTTIVPAPPPLTTRAPLIPSAVPSPTTKAPPVVPTTTVVAVPPVVTTSSTLLVIVTRSTTTTPSTSVPVPLAANDRNAPTTTSSVLPGTAASGGVSTETLVGGIVGGILGTGVLCLIVIFFVRFWRKRLAKKAAFHATTFKQSAVILNDPPAKKSSSNNPRPPTMIEHCLAAPAIPPVSYGYEHRSQYRSDSYYNIRHNSSLYNDSLYGSEHHYIGDQIDAVSAYGQAAGYGAYGAPPTHTPHPQYPQQQQQPQHFPEQSSSSPGQVIERRRASPPYTGYSDLPNSFAPNPVVSATVVAAPRNVSPTQPQPTLYLHRRPTQVGGAPPAYEPKYANVQRDAKVTPPTVSTASRLGGSGPDANERPTSHTVYSPADAYGGI